MLRRYGLALRGLAPGDPFVTAVSSTWHADRYEVHGSRASRASTALQSYLDWPGQLLVLQAVHVRGPCEVYAPAAADEVAAKAAALRLREVCYVVTSLPANLPQALCPDQLLGVIWSYWHSDW